MEDFDVREMSEETGLSVYDIKKTLNLPPKAICFAISARHAKQEFEKAARNSEEKLAAFILWESLSKDDIRRAQSFDELIDAFVVSPRNDSCQIIFGNKLESFLKTLDQTITAFNLVMSLSQVDEMLCASIIKIWNYQILIEVGKAETFWKKQEVFLRTFDGSEMESIVFNQLIDMASTADEIKYLCNLTASRLKDKEKIIKKAAAFYGYKKV